MFQEGSRVWWNSWIAVALLVVGMSCEKARGVSEPVQPFLVEVESTYPDTARVSSQARVKVRGSGWLFQHQGRNFVLTASHVSQGEAAAVKYAGAVLPIVDRKVSAEMDAEIFEVTLPAETKAPIDFDGTHFKVSVGRIAGPGRWMDRYNFVPAHSWIFDPNQALDNQLVQGRAVGLFMDSWSSLLHSDALIQPGMSGAPLLVRIPSAQGWNAEYTPFDPREGFGTLQSDALYVRGLAIRRERFFAASAFLPAHRLAQFVKEYLERKTKDPRFRWQAAGALLFRQEAAPGTLVESRFIGAAMAGGVVIDGGNGVSMDGGDTRSLYENDPRTFLSKVSALPYSDGEPAVYWLLAMRSPLNSRLVHYLTWFDLEYYQSMARWILGLGVDQNSEPLKWSSLVANRLGKKLPFRHESSGGVIEAATDLIKVNIPLKDGDGLGFALDSLGRYCPSGGCTGTFVPVIEVVSRKSVPYIVDVRGLFVSGLSGSRSLSLRQTRNPLKDREDGNRRLWEEIELAMSGAQVVYRVKGSAVALPSPANELLKTTVQF